jgi:two-component system, chemotaxis family, protein-glutamate methylesterase/glutaminase
VNGVRPSANVLFKSVANFYEGNILAVILTGMGKDSRDGVRAMKKQGCICFSQKAETCAVYGMLRSVDEPDLMDESLDPLSITQKIVTAVQ